MERAYQYRFSIFTATYNRGNFLSRLYESLIHQDYKGPFEWVLVSDGSTDNTDDIIIGYINENRLKINYICESGVEK